MTFRKTHLLIVQASTRAKRVGVIKTGPSAYQVAVSAAPNNGQGNAAIIKSLAKHLRIAPSRLSIRRGHHSRNKIIEMAD